MVSDWEIIAAVLGVAAVISFVNYLGLRRSFVHRQVPPDAERMPQAYRVMEAALASQARRLDAQSQRMDELEMELSAQRARHQEEMGVLRAELEEAYRGLRVLLRQLGEVGIAPEWSLPAAVKLAAKKGGGRGEGLARRVVEGFSREEMDSLADDVGIDPEAVVGESREAKGRELVALARRVGKLDELARRVDELRPAE